MDGQPGPQADPAGVPGGRRAGGDPARRRRPGLARRRARRVRRAQRRRRGGAQQQPAAQPGRVEGPGGHGRAERGARDPRVRVGHGDRPEDPGDGVAGCLRGRPRPRPHARCRGAAGGDLRADPVPAGHTARARVPAGDRAADDQQVLRHGSGARPQHDRVPGVAGSPGVRDLMAQPRRPASRLGHRRLRPGHRGRAEHRPLHLRRGQGQHLRALLGRHHVLDGGRAPGRHRRPGAGRLAVSRGDRARPGAGQARWPRWSTSAWRSWRSRPRAPAATWTAARWPRCSPGCGPTT